jgi:hypothetical protein
MTEQVPPGDPEDTRDLEDPASQEELSASVDETRSTGVRAVDQVLADADRIDDLPLEEHLGAFERVHGALRSALDAEPGDPA